ncbi:MAG: site-specific integrase, partial [Cyclobacteriaceae bacterium]|nr:site-specific integrase [Cyclobacteriaceae bacterium]
MSTEPITDSIATKKLQVRVEKLFHREQHSLALFFPNDLELKSRVRKIAGATWSQTNKCWYVANRKDLLGEILAAFKDAAWVNLTALTKNKEQKIDSPKEVQAPVSKPVIAQKEIKKAVVVKESEESLQLLRMMEQKLNLRGYSKNTCKTYLQQFKEFLRFYSGSPIPDLTEIEIRNYIIYLVEQRKVSKSIQNQAINAIKFFYEKMMMQDRKVYYLERPMREKKLPQVLSQEELMLIFEAAGNVKHRAMLMLIYAAGLRRSELLALRVGDVDLNRNAVFIRGGKGRKDRQSIMAQSLVPLLREYMEKYSPKFWLFEGQSCERYSESSLQHILKQAAAKAGIKKQVRLHMLRHSFATHLLESGTSTRYIQVLLGHESPVTTEIYAQVTRFGLDKILSPLDQIA